MPSQYSADVPKLSNVTQITKSWRYVLNCLNYVLKFKFLNIFRFLSPFNLQFLNLLNDLQFDMLWRGCISFDCIYYFKIIILNLLFNNCIPLIITDRSRWESCEIMASKYYSIRLLIKTTCGMLLHFVLASFLRIYNSSNHLPWFVMLINTINIFYLFKECSKILVTTVERFWHWFWIEILDHQRLFCRE